jgi:hypothetical protein
MFNFNQLKKVANTPAIAVEASVVTPVVANIAIAEIEETVLPDVPEVDFPDTNEDDSFVSPEDAVIMTSVFPGVTEELRKIGESEGTIKIKDVSGGLITLGVGTAEFLSETNKLNADFKVGDKISYRYVSNLDDYLLLLEEEEEVETVYEQPVVPTVNVFEEFNNFMKTDAKVIEISFDALEQYLKLAASRGLTGDSLIKESIAMMLINDDNRELVPEAEANNYKALEILGSNLVSIRGDLRKSIRIKLPEAVGYKQELTEDQTEVVNLIKDIAVLATSKVISSIPVEVLPKAVKVAGFVNAAPIEPVRKTVTGKVIPSDYPEKYEVWAKNERKKWCRDDKKPYIS